ncbi:histone deacetylase family protein [Methylibium sp.]|uniref:histone deacetylase family protein n=1 Tax=Methylibium sp. TaxID=2067992 RepID=UPI003D0BD1F6
MHAYYSDHYVLPLPEGHRFPMAKYRMLRDRIAAELPAVHLAAAPAASDDELARVHDPAWVNAVAEGALSAAQQREIGFPWSEPMVERSRRSVGATIEAARRALQEGVAANLAGGTHHAFADKGSGYCVFNDIAVAARLMQAEWQCTRHVLLRVAVIDLDVHQGNGTAAIFADDPTVFTLSLHGAKNFPFRKEASDLDVELPDGCRDAAYLGALDAALATLWARHREALPGLVFYLAGADPHEGDRLGRLRLSTAGMAERDRRVFAACTERRIPVVVTMGGGYGVNIEDTVAVQLATYREALAGWAAWQAPRTAFGDVAPGLR